MRCDLESRVLAFSNSRAALFFSGVKTVVSACRVDVRRQRRPAHRGPSAATACAPYRRRDAGPRTAQRQPQPLRNHRRAQRRWQNCLVQRRVVATARRHAVRALLASGYAGALAHVGASGAVSKLRLRRRAGLRLLVRERPVVAHGVRAGRVKVFATAGGGALLLRPDRRADEGAYPDPGGGARGDAERARRRVPICRLPGCECECSMMSMDAWWPIRAHLGARRLRDPFQRQVVGQRACGASSSSRQRNVFTGAAARTARPCRCRRHAEPADDACGTCDDLQYLGDGAAPWRS